MSLFPTVGRKQTGLRFAWLLLALFLWFGVFMHLVPFYIMVITSLKPATEAMRMPPNLLPTNLTFAAWKLILHLSDIAKTVLTQPLSRYFLNSMIMTIGTMILSIPVIMPVL